MEQTNKDLTNNKYKVNIKTLIINIILTTLVIYLILGAAFNDGLSSLSITDILFEVVIDLFIELVVLKDLLYLKLLILSFVVSVILNTIAEILQMIKYSKSIKLSTNGFTRNQ